MEIIRAKNAGFCFGVKQAIEETYRILKSTDKKIYSIGTIIHNEIVVEDLKKKGLVVINDIEDIKKIKNEIVLIRTHGIEKDIYELLEKNGNQIKDLTCPFVKKIHKLVIEYSEKGYNIIVIGDKNHPEVKAIVSYAKSSIWTIIDENDIKKLKIDKNSPVLVVFQTTTNVRNGQKLVDILKELFYNYKVEMTICNETEKRQQEVRELAGVCDVMFIIGSKTSSNSRKLYEISKEKCKNTFFLNDKKDLLNINIKDATKIGVSAGASTPENLIEEILTNARNEF